MKRPILFVLTCILYGCTGNEPKSIVANDNSKPVTTATINTKPIKKTVPVEITNAEPFLQGMDDFKVKIKAFDPSMGDFNEMVSDSLFYEAKDAHHNKLWVAGANNGISEVSWIWNHDGPQKPPTNAIKNFSAIAKMICGEKGRQWVLAELRKPVTIEKSIDDTTHINHNELIFYNDAFSTINFTIKMQ